MNLSELNNKKYSKGSTLVELLIAMVVFSLVTIMVVNVFSGVLKDQQGIVDKKNLLDNSRYAMEFMTKELRMAQINSIDPGATFRIDGTTSFVNSTSPVIVFTNSSNDNVTYSLSGSKIMRQAKNNDTLFDTGNQPISSDEINISQINFHINNWGLSGGPGSSAPTITIFIKAVNLAGTSSLELQSIVTPRLF